MPKTTTVAIDMLVDELALQGLQSIPECKVISIQPRQRLGSFPVSLTGQTDILFRDALPSNFDQLTDLKWIQIASVDFSHLYGLHLPERGIRVTNARGIFDIA